MHCNDTALPSAQSAPNSVPADLPTVKIRGLAWHKPVRHAYDGFGTKGERYRGVEALNR